MRQVVFLLAGWLLGWSTVQAQHVRVHVPVDTVAIGERFPVMVAVEHPPGAVVRWPWDARTDTTLGDAEILRVQTAFSRSEVDSVVLEATTFALDSMRVGPFEVALRMPDGTTRRLSSPDVVIPVRSVVPPDATDIQDIAPLVSFPYPAWLYVLAAGLVVLLAAGLAALWKRRKKEEPEDVPVEEPPPGVPPYVAAMQALMQLEQRLPVHEAEIKPFYVAVSGVLRAYLADTLQIPAREQSSTELLGFLRQQSQQIPPAFSSELLPEMETLIRRIDLVKFAEFRPPPHQHRQTIMEIRRVVQEIESFQKTRFQHTHATLQSNTP